MNITVEMLKAAHETAILEAARAADEYLNERYGSQDRGACGFAWVEYWPEHKGNTKAGRAERRMMESIGYRKSYDGSYRFNNPSGWPGQNVDVRSQGAVAYAKRLEAAAGVKVYACDRLD